VNFVVTALNTGGKITVREITPMRIAFWLLQMVVEATQVDIIFSRKTYKSW